MLVGFGIVALMVAFTWTLFDRERRRRFRNGISTRVSDSVLGPLTYAEGEEWWVATVALDEGSLGFKIGGESVPDAQLVAHAHDIVNSSDAFRKKVRAFLDQEAAKDEPWAAEIRGLEIEDICLFWPDRPNDGMIYFDGSTDGRVWRCDYLNREPTGLGFDS